MHPNVHRSIIYNIQNMEAILVPINRSMDKSHDIYIMEYCLTIKKECNFATCNNMDEPEGYYA